MSFNDAYKSMLLNRGGNVNSSDIRNSKNSINRKFKDDPSYKLATLRKRDTTILDSDLDTRIINVDTDVYKKKIYVRPDTNIEAGDYIIYPNKTYLVLSTEDNLISPYANVEECNYILKWIDNETLHEMPVLITNQTKYTLGTDVIATGISEADSRFQINMPSNTESNTINVGKRFIFNKNAWKTTQVDCISTQGIQSLLLGQTAINYEVDNLDLEIADYKTVVHTYTYDIPTSFEVSEDSDYTLVYSIKDETGKDVDYNLVTISTTDTSLVQLTNTNGVITIKGLSAGIGSVKLVATLSSETKEFDIAFEVKETVVNQVNYQYSFSQPITGLKQYVTTTLTTSKFVNGIADSSLYINYSFDVNAQSLISQGKIVITRKSNSSISIKNSTITTPTIIYLTVTDSVDNTKILDNVAITLTGM